MSVCRLCQTRRSFTRHAVRGFSRSAQAKLVSAASVGFIRAAGRAFCGKSDGFRSVSKGLDEPCSYHGGQIVMLCDLYKHRDMR